jgi:hypothetical protein
VSEEDFLKSDSLSKQETDKLFQMLEVKLGQERRAWRRARSQIRLVRVLSFLFLVLLIAGAACAFYFIYNQAQEQRTTTRPQATIPAR